MSAGRRAEDPTPCWLPPDRLLRWRQPPAWQNVGKMLGFRGAAVTAAGVALLVGGIFLGKNLAGGDKDCIPETLNNFSSWQDILEKRDINIDSVCNDFVGGVDAVSGVGEVECVADDFCCCC